MREQIFANQKRLGVIQANAPLTSAPDGPAELGNSYRTMKRELFAREGRGLRRLHRIPDLRDRRVIKAFGKTLGKLDDRMIHHIRRTTRHHVPQERCLGTPNSTQPITAFEIR